MEDSPIADRLGAERRATLARMAAMTVDFDEIVAATSNSNIDDEHDPEGSTVAFERAQVASLLSAAGAYLAELDQAVARLAAGTYALCERCGGQIASERLQARPATRTCIRCAAGAS